MVENQLKHCSVCDEWYRGESEFDLHQHTNRRFSNRRRSLRAIYYKLICLVLRADREDRRSHFERRSLKFNRLTQIADRQYERFIR